MVSNSQSFSQESALQVELLESSFEKVKPSANEFISSFYNNLFTDYPAAEPLFAHTSMAKQEIMLLESLVFVVENLRQPGKLTGALKGLGARHMEYGALPDHYPLVGNSLLKTFGQYLGDDWTSETQEAWIEAYGLITNVMLEGADYDQAAIQLDSATATAEVPEGNIKPGTAMGLIGGGLIGLIILFLLV